MKKLSCKKNNLFLAGLLIMAPFLCRAQGDSVKTVPVVKLHYFNINNHEQYLILESMLKKGKQLTPQKDKTYALFLDSAIAAYQITTLHTDETGKARAFIPPALKTQWEAGSSHNFIVKEGEDEILSDYVIHKSKITLDTSSSDGVKKIIVVVSKPENGGWIPVKDVEMKIGIIRMGGLLSAGEEESYTTDSTGTVTVEVKKDSLPGDEKGNLILAAHVEDNDDYGNLQVEKTVPWGVSRKPDTGFFAKRTLWTTRLRTPYWLLLVAYSIVFSVWGTLIYLITQIVKIKKLGKVSSAG